MRLTVSPRRRSYVLLTFSTLSSTGLSIACLESSTDLTNWGPANVLVGAPTSSAPSPPRC